jgi:ketosteroid isomerase-like protein
MTAPPALRESMQRTNSIFSQQVVAQGDIDALDQVYTRNARVLPPGADMIEGLSAIKQFWKQTAEALSVRSVELTTLTAEPCGDSAVEIGRAALHLADGTALAVKYVVHWKQEDGQWKWDKDIWNANQC